MTIKQNYSGIRKALFQDWAAMRAGGITVSEAVASLSMANVILKSIEVQIKETQFLLDNPEVQSLQMELTKPLRIPGPPDLKNL
jgi:hypothetical protein